MIKEVTELEQPGFTLPDLEDALGYHRKSLYPVVRRGDLPVYTGPSGEMRVTYADAVLFAKWRLDYIAAHSK